jgi:hypothetical protein
MPWSSIKPAEFTETLEKSGEAEVRAALAREDKWVTLEGRSKIAEGWLTSKESSRIEAREARRDRRENITLAVAIVAAIIAAIAARADIKWLISCVTSCLT